MWGARRNRNDLALKLKLIQVTKWTGAACLAKTLGNVCFAHSLPSRPDFAVYQAITATSAPIVLTSRLNTAVIWNETNNVSTNGEHLLLFAHSIIR